MNRVRVILSFQVASIVFLMAGFPSYYHSHKSFVAQRHYDATPSPAALGQLEDAQRLDRRDVRTYEALMGTLLGVCVLAFVGARRKNFRKIV